MDFLKMFTGMDFDPDSPMGQHSAEAMKDMAKEFFKSEKGKKLIDWILKASGPALDELKKEMGNDDKRYMIMMDGDDLAFITLDMKHVPPIDMPAEAILKYKKLDNVGHLLEEFLGNTIFAPSVTANQVENKVEVKAIEEKK